MTRIQIIFGSISTNEANITYCFINNVVNVGQKDYVWTRAKPKS